MDIASIRARESGEARAGPDGIALFLSGFLRFSYNREVRLFVLFCF